MDNEEYVAKILALMAKAESTEFADEAETFFAKAQELMTKHAIDEAMLAGHTRPDEIVTVAVMCERPYGNAKAALLNQIGLANNCRVIRFEGRSGTYRCGLTGYRSDVKSVEMLFAGLVMHATRDLLKTPVPPYEQAKSFRHSFLLAFASRIGQRLEAARATAVNEAEVGSPGAAIVLVERDALVEKAFRSEHPHLRTIRSSNRSWSGSRAGRESADRAGLNKTIGSRKALTS